uniref:Uncharacterized protein n=1 Tax=Megaselia scalaris TaxID=36166 RepID=T1H588_MEGSC
MEPNSLERVHEFDQNQQRRLNGISEKNVSNYLSTQVTNMFSKGRSFTSVAFPEAGVQRICAIATIQ